MMQFTSDQWIIVLLVFLLGFLIGGFVFAGGGRKWKHRYNSELDKREEQERIFAEREREWRERDSLRAAAIKDKDREREPATDDPHI